MTFNKSFVLQKLEEATGYIKELEDFLGFSDKEILGDYGNLHIAERLLQLIVDNMIDINQHFIRELNLKSSEDFQSTFYILGENNILPKKFANKIAPVVGLRNRIVHRYETVDTKQFITSLRKNFSDFEKYISFIYKKLDQL